MSITITVGNVLTGFLLAMFVLFFFLKDGRKIWLWFVRMMPQVCASGSRIRYPRLRTLARMRALRFWWRRLMVLALVWELSSWAFRLRFRSRFWCSLVRSCPLSVLS